MSQDPKNATGDQQPSEAEIRAMRVHILKTGRLGPKGFMELTAGSYRQVQYRDTQKALSPSERRGKDEKYRLYTFWDVLKQEIANALHANGYSQQKIFNHPNAKRTKKRNSLGVAVIGLLTLIVRQVEARDRRPLVPIEECVLYIRRELVPVGRWKRTPAFFVARGYLPRINKKGPDPLAAEWVAFDFKSVADRFIAAVTASKSTSTHEAAA